MHIKYTLSHGRIVLYSEFAGTRNVKDCTTFHFVWVCMWLSSHIMPATFEWFRSPNDLGFQRCMCKNPVLWVTYKTFAFGRTRVSDNPILHVWRWRRPTLCTFRRELLKVRITRNLLVLLRSYPVWICLSGRKNYTSRLLPCVDKKYTVIHPLPCLST